ncbi:MAG: hypothetical protein AYK19_11595 [Theionarchaea archaeon DG-70-1]|nr:MAG: hypothetical protein AYK19_11595 [Theionarchaea archaeon DG-70-1]
MPTYTSDLPKKPVSLIAQEFSDYIRSKHPRYDYRECLDIVIEVFIKKEESGKNPSTSDLAAVLGTKNQKIISRVKAIQPRYIQIDKRNSGRFYVRIGSEFRYTRDKIQEVYEYIVQELKRFIKENFKEISNERCIRAIKILYPEIFHWARQKKLSKMINKYRELLQILNEENLNHDLPDINKGTTSYRYILTGNGRDVYYVWLRGEFK